MQLLHTILYEYEIRPIDSISRKKTSKLGIEDSLKKMIPLYHMRGILVNAINTDNKFECIKNTILLMTLNVVSVEEHMREVERSIRTVKEGTIYHVQRPPYTHYHRVMVRSCIIATVGCFMFSARVCTYIFHLCKR